jgi:hypothetical protein
MLHSCASRLWCILFLLGIGRITAYPQSTHHASLIVQLGHTASLTSVTFSPDGKYILTGSEDRSAVLWDALDAREIKSFEDPNGKISSASFSPDGQTIDAHTRDCLITGYEELIPSLKLPDPDDRHVLAAAIVGRCDAIVTANLKDFPEDVLAPYGIDLQHPDEFLCNHLNLAPGLFCSCVQKVRRRLKKPFYTADQYLDNLTRNGLVATASELRSFAELL